jgi:hypothetical protein
VEEGDRQYYGDRYTKLGGVSTATATATATASSNDDPNDGHVSFSSPWIQRGGCPIAASRASKLVDSEAPSQEPRESGFLHGEAGSDDTPPISHQPCAWTMMSLWRIRGNFLLLLFCLVSLPKSSSRDQLNLSTAKIPFDLNVRSISFIARASVPLKEGPSHPQIISLQSKSRLH